jgi:ATP-binding cassette, subfamily F, member 3
MVGQGKLSGNRLSRVLFHCLLVLIQGDSGRAFSTGNEKRVHRSRSAFPRQWGSSNTHPLSRWSFGIFAAQQSSSMTTNVDENRGDARGAALLLEGVTVYRGPAEILRNIDWRVEPRTKWALVGANGAGKSTLLKALVGEVDSHGKIVIGNKEQVGYLQQTAVAGSNGTVFEEASSGMRELNTAKQAMEKSQEVGDLQALERATTRFELIDGYKQEQKVASVLKGLGFTNFEMRCHELSGGWQMRVAFARLLLSEPTLCLMDEPSNHLDAAAKKWLAKYLATYDGDGAMILVTHDVDLLKSMDHIAEVVPGAGSLQIYKSCNYNQYLDLKEQRAAAAISQYERNTEKAAKLQAFVDRFGASATKASAAQSRVKMLEKMKRDGLLNAPADDIIAQRFKPSLILPDPPRAIGEKLISLQKAGVGYDGEVLVSDINIDIMKGMKLLIRGPNGAGKSTVMHSLRGSISLIDGDRSTNPDLRLGVFTQDLAQELDPSARAVDLVTAYARTGLDGDITVSEQEARAAMGRLGLQGEKALRHICDLSGGEKARVALAMFALKASNVYLLDEASNHLDSEWYVIEASFRRFCCNFMHLSFIVFYASVLLNNALLLHSVEALGEGLGSWGHDTGAMVVISHDKSFCDRIDFTHVATVQDGNLILEERGACESDWVIEGLSGQVSAAEADTKVAGVETTTEIDPILRKQAFNAPKRIAKLEQLIGEAEDRAAALEDEMLSNGCDVGKLVDLTKDKEALELKISEYMEEWEQLEALLAQVT